MCQDFLNKHNVDVFIKNIYYKNIYYKNILKKDNAHFCHFIQSKCKVFNAHYKYIYETFIMHLYSANSYITVLDFQKIIWSRIIVIYWLIMGRLIICTIYMIYMFYTVYAAYIAEYNIIEYSEI